MERLTNGISVIILGLTGIAPLPTFTAAVPAVALVISVFGLMFAVSRPASQPSPPKGWRRDSGWRGNGSLGGLVGTEGSMLALLHHSGLNRAGELVGIALARLVTLWFVVAVGLFAPLALRQLPTSDAVRLPATEDN